MNPYGMDPRSQAAAQMLSSGPQPMQQSALEELNAKRKREAQEAAGRGGGLLGTILGGVIGGSIAGPAGVGAGSAFGGSVGSQGVGMLGGLL